ncbi:MAG: ferric reductase-like transmembrane domain-containing protein [Pseudomonadota bacterium]
MPRSYLVTALSFVLAHIAFVAPFVPAANILPAGLGALSMTSMALALILAARWRIVDRLMGGPDKSYFAHRCLGFFALAGALGHWALASSVGAGVLPVLAESGADVGNIAAVGLIVMTAAAMVRAIPYHLWKLSHMLMGPIFLLAAYHTFFVASPLAVGAAPWALMAAVSVLGLVAWGQTLLRKISPTRLMTVETVAGFDGGVDVTFRAAAPLPPFRPGQFATIANNYAGAEAHPFTIAGGDDTSRRFVIRAAGDWTDDFVANVTVGDRYRLGRGVGRFLPQVGAARPVQFWVAGGVGITPFLAALERMQPDGGARVTLIYCVRTRASAGAIADVERHAARLPQVDLVVLNEADGSVPTPIGLAKLMRGKPETSQVFVCGPEGLKAVVTRAWHSAGMSGPIHSERFDFRGAYGLTDLIYLGKPALDAARAWVAIESAGSAEAGRHEDASHAASGT